MKKQYKKKKVLFISSTGGHLSELLQLEPLFERYDSYVVTEKTKINLWLKKKYKTYYLLYGARNFPIRYFFKFLINLMKSFHLFFKIKPDIVVSTGAHTSVPMCFIAKIFRKKIIFIETFAKIDSPTLSGKLIYPIADAFYVQWENMKNFYPKAIYKGGLF